GEPAIELVPEAPGGDGIRGGLGEEHAFPGHENVVEPHLPVELVEAAAQRGQERIRMTRGDLAAEERHAGGIDGDHEGSAMPGGVDAGGGPDVDVLRVGGARVHADLAAQHQARVGLAHYAEGRALGGIGAEPIADGRGARAKGEEASGAGDQLTVAGGVIELPVGDLALEYDIADAESDE